MNRSKNNDVWIGVIALIIIGGLGIWWVMSHAQPSSSTAVTTAATSTMATTTMPAVQQPQTIDRSSQSVVAIAESIPGASDYASWIASTGVGAMLTGTGPYTIFVPTDGAVSELPTGTISGLSAAGKKRLVEYSVVSGRAVDVTAETAGSIQALSGDMLNFSDSSTNIPMVNSSITITEYKGNNGVVYLIDNVLIPPSTTDEQL